MSAKKKIVVIGGGNGASLTLAALKPLSTELEITGITNMCDSGGSTGKLRVEFNCLPPGDILRNILALSKYDFEMVREIFYKTRFEETGKLSAHNIGNIFLTLGTEYTGDFMSSVRALSQALKIVGQIIPATLVPSDLVVELDSGEKIKGETNVDCPRYDRTRTIANAWLEPKAMANPEAIAAITQADYIILGGGDIYSSLIAAMLPVGIQQAIAQSSAPVVYISNRHYHRDGEAVSHTVSEIMAILETYTLRPIDMVVADPTPISGKEIAAVEAKNWGIKKLDTDNIQATLITGSFDAETVGINTEKLSTILRTFLV